MSSHCSLFLRKGTNGVPSFHLAEKKCGELSTLICFLLCQTYLNTASSNKLKAKNYTNTMASKLMKIGIKTLCTKWLTKTCTGAGC